MPLTKDEIDDLNWKYGAGIAAIDSDPGDCNDYPNDKRGFSSPLNTTAAIDDALAGTPAKDLPTRKQLEKALHYVSDHEPDGALCFGHYMSGPYLRAVIEAARKHLETLPKPEPRFRVVGQRRCGGTDTYNYIFRVREAADTCASKWMATGRYDSVGVEEML
jgi:hypothetical protein